MRHRRFLALLTVPLATALAIVVPAGSASAGTPVVAGQWALDEGGGTTAADSSGNGHNGTLSAGASWVPGQIGSHAVAFNGTVTGNVDIPEPVIDTSQSFTVSAWVKLNSTSGYQTAVSIDGTNISGFYLQLSAASGAFSFTRRIADSGSATEVRADSTVAPAAGTWYHLVGVNDVAAGKLKIFVDEAEGTEAAFTSSWKAGGHTEIGRGLYNGQPVDFVNGAVDDVRVYQGALTADQVLALNQSAHWTYDEGSGGTAADSSGNGHTATLGSGATWVAGRVGTHALALGGTATATAPGPVVDTSGSFSVSAWVRLNTTARDQVVASVNGGRVSGYQLAFRAGTGFAFSRPASDVDTAAVSSASATASPAVGQWYHLAGVDDAVTGKLLLYVNGLLAGSAPYGTPWQAGGDTVVGAGQANGGPSGFLDGAVDDVRLYPYAMSLNQVQAIAGNVGGTLNVDAGNALHPLPSTFFGLMTEDINHSMTGGLYPELINNRSMMASADSPVEWSGVGGATIGLDPSNPLNTALTRSLKVDLPGAARAGVSNGGYWGIPVKPRQTYTASFFAKATAGFTGPLTVNVESPDGSKVYASAKVTGVGTGWQRFTARLTAADNAPTTAEARFVLTTTGGGTLWLDNVSLFPPTYDNVPNGLRTDLMTKFAALKPAFIREPGGNYLEGNTIATRFNWKDTIGPVWTRPGHLDDAWGYWSTDGMGLLEYLEWCEQLGAQPMLAVYAGYSLNGTHVPLDQLGPYVQDALDEIQYATGPVTTPWGRKRAEDGHPAPFQVSYVEVGNEDFFDRSGSYDGDNGRFAQFYDAIKKAYPAMKVIATTPVTARTPDVVDDHYYQSPAWMNTHANLYDGHSRSGPKIMVGEWAAQEGSPTPDLNAAVGDASWLTGLMRNSDLVTQEAYAPMLVNVHDVTWKTNLIGFDALTSYGSPSYYAQQMLAANHGDQVLGSSYTGVGGINTVATRDSRTGRIYLAVVNPSGSEQPVTVNVTGARHLGAKGRMTVLSATHPTDTNTISDPAKVVPYTQDIDGLGANFTRTVPACSVTVYVLG